MKRNFLAIVMLGSSMFMACNVNSSGDSQPYTNGETKTETHTPAAHGEEAIQHNTTVDSTHATTTNKQQTTEETQQQDSTAKHQ